MARLVLADRKGTQITTGYNRESISEFTTCQSRRATAPEHKPVTVLSDENRKLRLQFARAHQNKTIEVWKNVPGLMSLDFCCDIQMEGQQHESMDPSCLESTAQAAGDVMVCWLFSWPFSTN